jgi:Flp pilus assembly pilin Flp
MSKIFRGATTVLSDDSGATVIEYGLLTALIALFLAGTIGAIGDAVAGMFNLASDAFPS